MQKNKVEIIKKEIANECWTCEGRKAIYDRKKDKIEICSTCNGTGKFIEYIYYHCVNGICVDGDTLK